MCECDLDHKLAKTIINQAIPKFEKSVNPSTKSYSLSPPSLDAIFAPIHKLAVRRSDSPIELRLQCCRVRVLSNLDDAATFYGAVLSFGLRTVYRFLGVPSMQIMSFVASGTERHSVYRELLLKGAIFKYYGSSAGLQPK